MLLHSASPEEEAELTYAHYFDLDSNLEAARFAIENSEENLKSDNKVKDKVKSETAAAVKTDTAAQVKTERSPRVKRHMAPQGTLPKPLAPTSDVCDDEAGREEGAEGRAVGGAEGDDGDAQQMPGWARGLSECEGMYGPLEMRKAAAASALFEAALHINANHVPTLCNYATFLASHQHDLSSMRRARQMLTRAVRLQPTHLDSLASLAALLAFFPKCLDEKTVSIDGIYGIYGIDAMSQGIDAMSQDMDAQGIDAMSQDMHAMSQDAMHDLPQSRAEAANLDEQRNLDEQPNLDEQRNLDEHGLLSRKEEVTEMDLKDSEHVSRRVASRRVGSTRVHHSTTPHHSTRAHHSTTVQDSTTVQLVHRSTYHETTTTWKHLQAQSQRMKIAQRLFMRALDLCPRHRAASTSYSFLLDTLKIENPLLFEDLLALDLRRPEVCVCERESVREPKKRL